MNSVAPVWDGNETWLVLGGGGLLAVFPLAYAMIMPALYAPIIAMLLALIFRGVAFEFRWRDRARQVSVGLGLRRRLDAGGLRAGHRAGRLLQGIPVASRAYAGGWWDWLTPFSLLTGVALVVGYALLGATWLIMKTEGALQERAYRFAWITRPWHAGPDRRRQPVDAVSESDRHGSAGSPGPHPLRGAGAAPGGAGRYRACSAGLNGRREVAAVPRGAALFVLSYIGLGISFYPYIVPEHYHLGGGGAREQPGLPAGRRRRADPADPCLHRLFLLGVSRQGRPDGGYH